MDFFIDWLHHIWDLLQVTGWWILFGLALSAVMQAVLPQMRARRSGTIVNYSSIAALRAAVGSGYYAASKAAVIGFTKSAD